MGKLKHKKKKNVSKEINTEENLYFFLLLLAKSFSFIPEFIIERQFSFIPPTSLLTFSASLIWELYINLPPNMSLQPPTNLNNFWLFPFNSHSLPKSVSPPELIDDLLNTKKEN
jgi:hypothetical protein